VVLAMWEHEIAAKSTFQRVDQCQTIEPGRHLRGIELHHGGPFK
jgi:hypothetical protein